MFSISADRKSLPEPVAVSHQNTSHHFHLQVRVATEPIETLDPRKHHREILHDHRTPLPTSNVRRLGIRFLRHSRQSSRAPESLHRFPESRPPPNSATTHKSRPFLQCEHFQGDKAGDHHRKGNG